MSIAMLLCQRPVLKRSMGVWTKRSPCLSNEAVEMITQLSRRILGGVKKYQLALNVSRLWNKLVIIASVDLMISG